MVGMCPELTNGLYKRVRSQLNLIYLNASNEMTYSIFKNRRQLFVSGRVYFST